MLDPRNIENYSLDASSVEIVDIKDIYDPIDFYKDEVEQYGNNKKTLEALNSFGLSLLLLPWDEAGVAKDFIEMVYSIEDTEENMTDAKMLLDNTRYIKYDTNYQDITGTTLDNHFVTILVEIDENGVVKDPNHVYAYDRYLNCPYQTEGVAVINTWNLNFYEYGNMRKDD